MESFGVSALACLLPGSGSCVLGNSISPDSALCSSWRVLKTCRRDEVISAAVIGVKDTCVCTISDAISMSFLGIGDPFGIKVNGKLQSSEHLYSNRLVHECNTFRVRAAACVINSIGRHAIEGGRCITGRIDRLAPMFLRVSWLCAVTTAICHHVPQHSMSRHGKVDRIRGSGD